MLTFADIIDSAELALRGALSSRVAPGRFVNVHVGGRFVTAHQWCYLDGRLAPLELVAGQSTYELPADFGEIRSITDDQGIIPRVRMMSWPSFLPWKGRGYGPAVGSYWGAINREVGADGTFVAKLHLVPEPTESAVLMIGYRAHWHPLSRPEDVAHVPLWAEPALLDLARLAARALHMPGAEIDPMASAIRQWRMSDDFAAATAADGMEAPNVCPAPSTMEHVLETRRRVNGGMGPYFGPQSTTQDLLADL